MVIYMKNLISLLKTKNILIGITGIIILCAVGFLPIHYYKQKQVQGSSTQVNPAKTDNANISTTPTEQVPEQSPEQASNPVSTGNSVRKTAPAEATPAPTPAPTPTPAPEPTPTPKTVTCDDFKKQTLINQEDMKYQQILANEKQRHDSVMAPLYDAQNRCGNRVGGLCDTWGTELVAENKLHETNLAKYLADHEQKLAIINDSCY